MANYIKVRPEVARYLDLDTERPMTADGNYALWVADVARLGPMRDRERLIREAGGVWLTDIQLREEQRGKLSTPLPEITDPRIPRLSEPEGSAQDDTEENNSEESEEPETLDWEEGHPRPGNPEETEDPESSEDPEEEQDSAGRASSPATQEEGGDEP